MTWRVLSPVEVCDFLDFWRSQTWPMVAADTHALGAREFGWTLEVEDDEEYPMAYDYGLTIPDVSISSVREGVSRVGMWVSDVIREVTTESTNFLGDNYALMVREGASRWGKPSMYRGVRRRATWEFDAGGKILLSLSDKAIVADFYTPQGVEVDRRAGY
ncbi:MAG: DUF6301 family protein [Acidobacteriota bacterium]|nr:DUF6301 family protein [Acidobacteriota bacterium]